MVLVLHVLGLTAVLQLGAWKDRVPAAPEQAPLLVWLLSPAVPAAAPVMAPAAARAPARPVARPGVPREQPEPQAITLPSPSPNDVSPATAPAAASAAAAAAPPPAAGPAPLNLALPRGASAPWRGRNPALDDPRANTPHPTLESRITAALGGSDQITEERLGDGRMRFRRGTDCVIVHPNRAQGLDPWNGSVLPKMRGVQKC